ncbi:hypothetical protein Ga0074812_102133 [Parafrankia irregularis]|uniref:Uncharacterized protein n=1 Tax=Parafrankia irregularis TaxID=795642 RepID=A0A0S4QF28_9ACTN|nr:hypothetical protein [Parafrankia irregularis]CUU54129.1 hypothetical protein Ga0074812_102133 [Parafrankia irregularis]
MARLRGASDPDPLLGLLCPSPVPAALSTAGGDAGGRDAGGCDADGRDAGGCADGFCVDGFCAGSDVEVDEGVAAAVAVGAVGVDAGAAAGSAGRAWGVAGWLRFGWAAVRPRASREIAAGSDRRSRPVAAATSPAVT